MAYSAEVLARYTDEALAVDLTGIHGPGPQHCATYLLRLDTPERRVRAQWEGNTLTNIQGGRPSGNVADAVFSLLVLIRSGKEDEELYGEAFARKELEQQRALREQREHHDRIAFEAYQARMAKGVS